VKDATAAAGGACRTSSPAREPDIVEKPSEGALTLFDGDRDRARRFVERELGPLAGRSSGRQERMLSTLEAFLENGQRIVNASAATGGHRDTVHRHLREIEHLLGCRVENRSAELLWALRLRRELLSFDS
jgi:DNA-binding PucR family transcriptional regulator